MVFCFHVYMNLKLTSALLYQLITLLDKNLTGQQCETLCFRLVGDYSSSHFPISYDAVSITGFLCFLYLNQSMQQYDSGCVYSGGNCARIASTVSLIRVVNLCGSDRSGKACELIPRQTSLLLATSVTSTINVP